MTVEQEYNAAKNYLEDWRQRECWLGPSRNKEVIALITSHLAILEWMWGEYTDLIKRSDLSGNIEMADIFAAQNHAIYKGICKGGRDGKR